MISRERAIDAVREYWRAAGARDPAAGRAVMAENVVRIGPFNDSGDCVRGREEYSRYIQTVQGKMDAYTTETHQIQASDDGRQVFLLCTERPRVGDVVYEYPLCIFFEVNDDSLIEKIDIYWKNPADHKNDWVRFDLNS